MTSCKSKSLQLGVTPYFGDPINRSIVNKDGLVIETGSQEFSNFACLPLEDFAKLKEQD